MLVFRYSDHSYKQVVIMKRARWCVGLDLLLSIQSCLKLLDTIRKLFRFHLVQRFNVDFIANNIDSLLCVNLFSSSKSHPSSGYPARSPEWNSTVKLVAIQKNRVHCRLFAALMICYPPFGLVLIARTILSQITGSLVILHLFELSLVYLNSSLNPLLYCWKIREVRK